MGSREGEKQVFKLARARERRSASKMMMVMFPLRIPKYRKYDKTIFVSF